ncbi:hypothetical protein LB312_10560 [Bacillus tropicus]|uniref:hypothetical protein n=1 Tax=Bacillus tropicus TaxID=2026188 RepID=UPI001E3DF892|nr:hypothetical protein [Bacillus tropicus]MCC1487709.1 hypothetical protein [Bacillus tropicus]
MNQYDYFNQLDQMNIYSSPYNWNNVVVSRFSWNPVQQIQQGAQHIGQQIQQGAQHVGQQIQQGAQHVGQQAQQGAQHVGQQTQQAAQHVGQQIQQTAQHAKQKAILQLTQAILQKAQQQGIPLTPQQAQQMATQWAQQQGIPTSPQQVQQMATQWAQQQGIPTSQQQVQQMATQWAQQQGIPTSQQQAQQMATQWAQQQGQQIIHDVQHSEIGQQITSATQGITDIYNQISNITKMFKPCAVPPGFTYHDNLIRRISLFGQNYSLIVRICYPLRAQEQIQRVMNKCNQQATQAALQYGGAALAAGSFTFGASVPAAFSAALTAYENTFLACLQNPENLGIQFSIFIY